MEKRKRTHEIHLRLNDKEYAALERNSKKCGLPQQTYLRYMCRNVIPREAPQAEFFECLTELRRIGNNLNQLARIANRGEFLQEDYYVRNAEKLWDVIHELIQSIVFPEDFKKDYLEELIGRNTQ